MYKSLSHSKLVQICTNLSLSEIKIVVPALLHYQSCYPVVGVSVVGCRGGGGSMSGLQRPLIHRKLALVGGGGGGQLYTSLRSSLLWGVG